MLDTMRKTIPIGGYLLPLPWLIVAVLSVVTITTVAVVRERPQAVPGVPAQASAALDAWAQATIQRDYVTAREFSGDPAFVYGVWQDWTDKLPPFTGYTVQAVEVRGQTIDYTVRFDGPQPQCLRVIQDAGTGVVSTSYPYYACE